MVVESYNNDNDLQLLTPGRRWIVQMKVRTGEIKLFIIPITQQAMILYLWPGRILRHKNSAIVSK